MEAALRESEEKFRLLFEKSVDPIALIHEGKYIDCNEAAVKHVRCANREELIGRGPLDFSPERQPDGCLSSEKARGVYDTTFRDGTSHFEWMRRTKTGEEFWVDVSHTVILFRGNRSFTRYGWTSISASVPKRRSNKRKQSTGTFLRTR